MAKRVSTSPTGSARLARASIQASNDQFAQMENMLGQDLMARLKGEHEREIECLWEEQLMLREELERIVDMMQKEILPREKQMHEMVEKMQHAWEEATRNVHDKLTQSSELAGMSAEQRRQIEQLHDPMAQMEKELDRIAVLLGHDIVKPDIRGWQQQQARQPSAASPGRMQIGSPSAGRAQIGSPSVGRAQTSYTGSSAQSYQQRYQGSSYQQAPTASSWQQNRAPSFSAAGGYGGSTYKTVESPTRALSGGGSPYTARSGMVDGGGSPYGSRNPTVGGMRSTTPGRTVSPSGRKF